MEILPSIISADFSKLNEEIKSIEESGLKFIHLDVMDGHFVNNLTFGPLIVCAIRKMTNLLLDTHLMISNPSKYLLRFYECSDIVNIHIETGEEAFKCLEIAKENNFKIGIVINPQTHPKYILSLLEDIDQVIVMTVNPGFAGQEMIESVLWKVEFLYNLKINNNLSFKISVDGGVNWDNIHKLKNLGVDRVVMGKSFFSLNFDKRKEYTLKFGLLPQ
ncbi:MAG: ribulose-phosphate 3-epimerase [candidate division WOR-3 bacterium]